LEVSGHATAATSQLKKAMPSIAEIIAAKNAKKKPLVIGQGNQAPLPAQPKEETRQLGSDHGEQIDMTPVNADQPTIQWHAALNAFESELCLMRDPADSEVAWLAVRTAGQAQPILLKSLPLFEHPRQVRPDNVPF